MGRGASLAMRAKRAGFKGRPALGLDDGKRLEKAGFKVNENRFVMELPEETLKKYALPAQEIMYFCERG